MPPDRMLWAIQLRLLFSLRHGTELLHEFHVIEVAPPLGSLSVDQAEDIDAADLDRLPAPRYAHVLAFVRPVHEHTIDHSVSLGNLILDHHLQIGECRYE